MNHQKKNFTSLSVPGAEIEGGLLEPPLPQSIKVGIGARSVRVKSTVNAVKEKFNYLYILVSSPKVGD